MERKRQSRVKEWKNCINYWFWLVGYVCTIWWLFSFLYQFLPATLIGFEAVESPGLKLNSEGVKALHPVVLVPGIVTAGLELWEGRPCADGLFRKRLWGATFPQMLKRPLCWLEHLSLHNETGLDPPGIRVRAVAADDFASGYQVWAVLIENLARIGYEGKNLHMATYDWRLSFQNTEIRDQSLSRLKSKIELMFVTNGYKKVVVVPQSMGAIYFLHFLKWVETPPPMGGGGGPGWCDKHIKAIMNISPEFLGVPKAVSNIFSAEGSDAAFVRTWDSIISLMPKGGETIWRDLHWGPKEGNKYEKRGHVKYFVSNNTYSCADMQNSLNVKEPINYGGINSVSKAVSQLLASLLSTLDSESEDILSNRISTTFNLTCENEMRRECIPNVGKRKATGRTDLDLHNFVAPKMMKRADAHFSHGIADNLDDPKYTHYKYWSNPLETKLPDAPNMEVYCLYGVEISTERSYVPKLSLSDKYKHIPFQINNSSDVQNGTKLQNDVYLVDGDERVNVVSSGFMCAKGWRRRTRFNPSSMATYIREYQQKQRGSVLEVRGLESGARVNNIMGNVALIEDILRVAAGATGANIGGDRIFSDIVRISERISLRL
ncbi:unnamed protein product [Trifolium pratense]|uniref:Uncharacterized protein n=1 Tax=Trifolium pratense TaxID=57577 RepID=A0ACB0KDJ0_TRIPR|nr:unnamed protein product [Trifolium pratense]